MKKEPNVSNFAILFMAAGTFLGIAILLNRIVAGDMPFEMMWMIPVATGFLHVIDMMVLKDEKISPPHWVLQAGFYITGSAWLAFTLEGVRFLGNWFVHPDQGTWEPLVTSTSLCAAVCVFFQRKYRDRILETGKELLSLVNGVRCRISTSHDLSRASRLPSFYQSHPFPALLPPRIRFSRCQPPTMVAGRAWESFPLTGTM